jgi:hypothetical protein
MYTLLVTGDVPGASTYFNPLLQQTIVPCTSGARPSSPPTGMHIFETDTTRLMKWTGAAWEAVASSRQSFTPTLTASTTNPTMGSGTVRNGWYAYASGPSVIYSFHIAFGTSPAAGSGNYSISLPVACANAYAGGNEAIGTVVLADASSGLFKVGVTLATAGSTLGMIVDGSVIVASGAPWTWAASDYLSGTITYPI